MGSPALSLEISFACLVLLMVSLGVHVGGSAAKGDGREGRQGAACGEDDGGQGRRRQGQGQEEGACVPLIPRRDSGLAAPQFPLFPVAILWTVLAGELLDLQVFPAADLVPCCTLCLYEICCRVLLCSVVSIDYRFVVIIIG